MINPAPTPDQALSFYRAALPVARFVDRDDDPRLLDAGADAAWRAYGSDLPAVVRCDLVLKNFAMLYPAAFAPGPVFGLAGWHEDDPWGAGFERPPEKVVEGLFASRAIPATASDALDQALGAWGLAGAAGGDLAGELSPSTNLVVVGGLATAVVAGTFLHGERLSARTQVVLVTDRPASRHVLGVACALLGEKGAPRLADLRRAAGDEWPAWANREKQRLGLVRARLLVASPDAGGEEAAAARALAAALEAERVVEIA